MGKKFSGIYWGIMLFTGILIYLSPNFGGNKFPVNENDHKINGLIIIVVSIIGIAYRTYQWFQEDD